MKFQRRFYHFGVLFLALCVARCGGAGVSLDGGGTDSGTDSGTDTGGAVGTLTLTTENTGDSGILPAVSQPADDQVIFDCSSVDASGVESANYITATCSDGTDSIDQVYYCVTEQVAHNDSDFAAETEVVVSPAAGDAMLITCATDDSNQLIFQEDQLVVGRVKSPN